MCKKFAKSAGFTLIELMVTIAIVGILVSIAIPSFHTTITSSRLTGYANDLVGALNLARSEAVKRGIQVTVRNNGAATHWENGWNVFVDINGNETNDAADTACSTSANGSPTEDCLLKTYPALVAGYTITTGGSTYQNYAAFLPSGLSNVVVGDTFRLCNGTDTTTSLAIVIDGVGRAYISPPGSATCP